MVYFVLQELLSKKEFPADVEGSRRLIDEHTQLKKKVGELNLTVSSVPCNATEDTFNVSFRY